MSGKSHSSNVNRADGLYGARHDCDTVDVRGRFAACCPSGCCSWRCPVGPLCRNRQHRQGYAHGPILAARRIRNHRRLPRRCGVLVVGRHLRFCICTQAQGISYCAALTLAGESDYRLPTVAELQSIVDVTRAHPAIDPVAFPGTLDEVFWSATPSVGSPGSGWVVLFTDGGSSYYQSSFPFRVRCVR